MKHSLLLVMLLLPVNLYAFDSNGNYTAFGPVSCEYWMEGREKPDNQPLEHFIMGVVSAANMFQSGSADFSKGKSRVDIYLYVDKFCLKNPHTIAQVAIERLVIETQILNKKQPKKNRVMKFITTEDIEFNRCSCDSAIYCMTDEQYTVIMAQLSMRKAD